MFEFIKGIFSFRTKSIKYSTEVIKMLVGIIIVGIGLIFTEIIFPNVLVIQILRSIVVFSGLEILISFYWRIILVSDNKEQNLIKNKKYKFKHEPINLSISDFEFLVDNAVAPETMYVESKTSDFHIIQIAFDITGIRGKFYNKHFLIDEEVILDKQIFLNKLLELCIVYDGKIKVYATFDYNKPEVLLSVIETLKNNK